MSRTEPQPMYPRTEWVHAVRRWFDGDVGPEGEQLTIPGMPEPPKVTAQRAWFLIVADYANPDGFVIASAESLQRRWLVSPTAARRFWKVMQASGWVRNLGAAYRGHSQRRELTVPKWALKAAEEAPERQPLESTHPGERQPLVTPLSGERQPLESERQPLVTPPEVVRSKSVSQVMGSSALPAPRGQAMTDLTDDQDHEPQPAGEDERSGLAGEAAAWLGSLGYLIGVDLHPTERAVAQVKQLVIAGITPVAARDRLIAAGHNLALLHGGGILKALERLPQQRTQLAIANPAARPVTEALDESAACDHGEPRGPSRCAICRILATKGIPA